MVVALSTIGFSNEQEAKKWPNEAEASAAGWDRMRKQYEI